MTASLIVGSIGLLVAVAGFIVNWRAIRREQSDRRQEIEDAWAREWASQRPVVYPLALPQWTDRSPASRARLLPLKNGGRGPALKVWRGHCHFA
jgi:Bacteriophage holin family, superfamily II-like